MSGSDLTMLVIRFVVLVPAIVFHEVAHGYAAYLLGDTTAKDRGRLSLNPVKHIDPFGTILMPLLMVVMFGFGFGYAKPVPVNPHRFKDYRKGMFLTGIAGPAANLLLAMVAGIAARALDLFGGALGAVGGYAWLFFFYFCLMNLVLMFFNLIPIPPLDGSRVVPLFLSDRAMRAYAKWERYGFVIVFGLIFFGPRLFGFDPIGVYFAWTVEPLLRLFAGAGF
ncbi:MAG: site-2 protease family protein [Actinomycetota bacterium]|nr:site-2 protease family protein [Actinomycetota bacterium]